MDIDEDQSLPAEPIPSEASVSAEHEPNSSSLPLRPGTAYLSQNLLEPPRHEAPVGGYHSQPLNRSWSAQDPRSSSSQSLLPLRSSNGIDGRKTLLLIYIHGFMGSEMSFLSFPAHIHNLTSSLLAETHVVYTKIYPKYRSRKAIEFARDDFSNW